MRFGSVLMFAAAAPLLIGASQPVRLQPSSGWVVDYAEDSCRLIRTFGEGQRQVKLAFEGEGPDLMDMLVVGKPLVNGAEEVGARFLPVENKLLLGKTAQTAEGGDPAILWSKVSLLPIAELEKEAVDRRQDDPQARPPARDLAKKAARDARRLAFADAASELEIQSRPGRPVILELHSLGPPIRAFDKCIRDSLQDWGVDPKLEDKIVRGAWAPNLRGILSSSDYPPKMLEEDQESRVKIRVLVDASGRVTKCTSLSHYKAPEFNEVTCRKFTERAHFEPAELADGTKVPSYYITRITFRIAK